MTAVIRDTMTGDCQLVGFENLDTGRLEEFGLELAGYIKDELDYTYADKSKQPYFTICVLDKCNKWILIVNDQAPEYCSEHEEL